MNKSRIEKVAVVFAALCAMLFAAAAPALAQTPSAGVQLQAAIAKEDVDGDLKSAIEMYQKIADDKSAPRDVRSRALLRLAGCYEKLGRQARQVYEQIARDFADQPAAAQARLRLAALRQATAGPATMTERKIDLPYPNDPMANLYTTDGRRQVYVDADTGAFVISDLAGKNKRVFFKPKEGERIVGYLVSRDLSVVSPQLKRVDGYHIAYMRTDGTGYGEWELVDGVNATAAVPDWSWDNRTVFRCHARPDGTRELSWFTTTEGQLHQRPMACGDLNRPSPDGRFLAISESYRNFGKVSVAPIQGGEPQLVSDNARLIDWTRDGRYLILSSARSGVEALYLLPVRDGQRSGDPIFVRNDACKLGSVNPEGSLVCKSSSSNYAYWLGTPDSGGRSVAWRELHRHDPSASWYFAGWSPDGSQVVYLGRPEASEANFAYVVGLHDIASGEEREVYKGSEPIFCVWPETAKLICTRYISRPPIQVFSVALDSGGVESLGSVSGSSGLPLFSSAGGQTVYMNRQPGDELIRWDAATRQATTVDRFTGVAALSERWLARRSKETIEIRPMAGGEWRPLISLPTTATAFTPDGSWLLFHDVDADGKHGLFRVSTSGGQPERIGDFPSVPKGTSSFNVSPDGRRLLTRSQIGQEVWILENFEPKQPAAKQAKEARHE